VIIHSFPPNSVSGKSEDKMEQLAVPILTAAQAIGIGRTKIYALIHLGELTKIKIGRRSLVTVESLVALIERARQRTLDENAGGQSLLAGPVSPMGGCPNAD